MNQPIGISDLLQSPECRHFMDQGLLISDGHVVELMLHAILQSPHPETGVLVDGFPRTKIQAQVLSLLYEKWTELRALYGERFP
jgi:adenylate kinase